MDGNPSRKCFVTYETRFSGRLDATAGLALLIASLGRHMPDIPLFIFHTKPCDHLRDFAKKHGPPCTFEQTEDPEFYSWYGKPRAVLKFLNSGFDRVCWIDADIIVRGNCSDLLFPKSKDEFVVSCDFLSQNACPERHIELYDAPPKQIPPNQINSSIFSASKEHISLIEEFRNLLHKWRACVNKTLSKKFLGDQEFLEAALMHFPEKAFKLTVIREFVNIIHCRRSVGIRGALRLLLRGTPVLLHAIEYKPWWPLDRPHWGAPRSLLDCYPYTSEARSYTPVLNDLNYDLFRDWLTISTPRSRLCHALPPWTKNSALFWFYLIHKISPESIDPPERELRTALAFREQQEAGTTA